MVKILKKHKERNILKFSVLNETMSDENISSKTDLPSEAPLSFHETVSVKKKVAFGREFFFLVIQCVRQRLNLAAVHSVKGLQKATVIIVQPCIAIVIESLVL